MAGKDSRKRRNQPAKADDFKSVARRLGCDDDKDRFEARLASIAKPKTVKASKARNKAR
jgi:hypothetical protein